MELKIFDNGADFPASLGVEMNKALLLNNRVIKTLLIYRIHYTDDDICDSKVLKDIFALADNLQELALVMKSYALAIQAIMDLRAQVFVEIATKGFARCNDGKGVRTVEEAFEGLLKAVEAEEMAILAKIADDEFLK